MKKLFFIFGVLEVLLFSNLAKAEKQNIKVSEFSIPDPKQWYFVVNPQGEILQYKYEPTAEGKIDPSTISYEYYGKAKDGAQPRLKVDGYIGKYYDSTEKKYGNYLTNKDGLISFEVVALERNLALVVFSDQSYTSKKAMVFRLVNNRDKCAVPTRNKNNPFQYSLSYNQEISFSNNQIVLYNFANPVTIGERKTTEKHKITLKTMTQPPPPETPVPIKHNLKVGDYVTVVGVSTNYDTRAVQVIGVPDEYTFEYYGPGDEKEEEFVPCRGAVFLNVLDQIDIFDINWKQMKNKGIDNSPVTDWGDLFVLNMPIQKYYMGINTQQNKVYVLKP